MMPRYEVVFNRHEKFSSDANVGTSPVPGATVVGPLCQADVADIEAETEADAEAVARVVYNGITTEITVTDVTPEPEEEPDEEAFTEAEAVEAEDADAAVTVSG